MTNLTTLGSTTTINNILRRVAGVGGGVVGVVSSGGVSAPRGLLPGGVYYPSMH